MIEQAKRLASTGFVHVFGSAAINRIIGMLSGIVLVRILTKSAYAQYTFAQNIFEYFNLLCGFGMLAAVLQACGETQNDVDGRRSALYQYGNRLGQKFNVFLGLGVLVFALTFPLPVEGSSQILAAMSFLPLLVFADNMQKTHLRVNLDNRGFSYVNTIGSVLIFVSSAIGALLWQTYGLIASRYFATGLCVMIASRFFHAPALPRKPTLEISQQEKKGMLNFAGISVLNNGLSQILYLAEITFIGIYVLDSSMVATYKVASTLPAALNIIPSAFIEYAYPYFVRHSQNKKWVRARFLQSMGGLALLHGVITAVLLLFAPTIFRLVFGTQYDDAIVPFKILMIAFFFLGPTRILAGNLLVTQRQLKFNTLVAFTSGLLHIFLLIALINQYNAMGAAIAHLITVLLTGIANVSYLLYCLRTRNR